MFFNTDPVYRRGYLLILPTDNSSSGGSKYHHKALRLFCVRAVLRSGSIRLYCPPARHWGRCCPLNFPFHSNAVVVTEALSGVIASRRTENMLIYTLNPSPTRLWLSFYQDKYRTQVIQGLNLMTKITSRVCINITDDMLRDIHDSKSFPTGKGNKKCPIFYSFIYITTNNTPNTIQYYQIQLDCTCPRLSWLTFRCIKLGQFRQFRVAVVENRSQQHETT